MKRVLICLSAGLASGCGGSQESASTPTKDPAPPPVATVQTEAAKPLTATPTPNVEAPKKEVDPPGLVLPEDDVIGGKGPELPIR